MIRHRILGIGLLAICAAIAPTGGVGTVAAAERHDAIPAPIVIGQSYRLASKWYDAPREVNVMASGHAYRTNRSNTWPHRPGSAEHQINPCQRGAVHTWRVSAALAGQAAEMCVSL